MPSWPAAWRAAWTRAASPVTRANSTLSGIGEITEQYLAEDAMASDGTKIEAHGRRCGSHLGHIILVQGDVLHCINGASLIFEPAA